MKVKDKLVITINDTSPEERKEWLINAIASAMRWYAHSPDKQKDDGNDIVVLMDLLAELNKID